MTEERDGKQCAHMIAGGLRCPDDALEGADMCRLHRGFIPHDPVPGSVGHDAEAERTKRLWHQDAKP